MFRYYMLLGLRSLRRNPVLTALMILTLAVGVAASVATLTILHVMSGDPIPHKSERLISPLLDNAPLATYEPGVREPFATQMSYRDVVALLDAPQGTHRTAVLDVYAPVEPARADLPVAITEGIAVTGDFFGMFDVPFLYGAPWAAPQDRAGATVAVLSRSKSEALFGKGNTVGKHLRIWNRDFEVIGVLNDWKPVPRYTHLMNGNGGKFNGEDDIFVPFKTAIDAERWSNGSTSCSSDSGVGYQGLLASECTWIQFWFELASPADRPALKTYLESYVKEQKRQGRYSRPDPVKTFNVMEWMQFNEVVSKDNTAAAWLSFGFLMLCMVNTMGLLLAKFSSRAPEVGVRRALGATRGDIFGQFMVEAGVIGLAGGLLGLALSAGSLWMIQQASRDLSVIANMDWQMLVITFVIAVCASLFAGLLPTWRSSRMTPALQLKTQ